MVFNNLKKYIVVHLDYILPIFGAFITYVGMFYLGVSVCESMGADVNLYECAAFSLFPAFFALVILGTASEI